MVEIGDEKATMGKDTLIESPARTPHLGLNEGGGYSASWS
jgi:hypothetical protein